MTLPKVLADRVAQGRFDVQRNECTLPGLSELHLRKWVAGGLLIPRGNGSYEICAPTSGTRDERAREAHRRQALAVQRGLPGSVLTGLSAVIAHGLATSSLPRDVELSREFRLQSRRRGVVATPWWGSAPVDVDGSLVQPVAEALVEVAVKHGLDAAAVSAYDALARDVVSMDEVADAVDLYGSRRLAVRARQLLIELEGRHWHDAQAC